MTSCCAFQAQALQKHDADFEKNINALAADACSNGTHSKMLGNQPP
jgi:hypothetical protein